MISKLLKYDLKKMMRILVYMYVISIFFACITRIVNIGKDMQVFFIIGKILEGCTYSAIVNILVNTFVHILGVFIKNFYKDESYLTHTLPVEKSKLLLSKYLSALIVVCVSVLTCVVSLLIVFLSNEFLDGLKMLVSIAIQGFNMDVTLFIVLMVVLLFLQICCTITMAFTAVIKANTYSGKRIFKGIIWFLVYYFGSSIATLMGIVIVLAIQGTIGEMFANVLSQQVFVTIFIVGIIAYLIYSVVFYIFCNKKFNEGVNLD